MRENAFCMVFHVRWISHHSSPNPTLVATRLGRDLETRGEKNPSHMENHTKCISCHLITFQHLYILGINVSFNRNSMQYLNSVLIQNKSFICVIYMHVWSHVYDYMCYLHACMIPCVWLYVLSTCMYDPMCMVICVIYMHVWSHVYGYMCMVLCVIYMHVWSHVYDSMCFWIKLILKCISLSLFVQLICKIVTSFVHTLQNNTPPMDDNDIHKIWPRIAYNDPWYDQHSHQNKKLSSSVILIIHITLW